MDIEVLQFGPVGLPDGVRHAWMSWPCALGLKEKGILSGGNQPCTYRGGKK